MLMLGRGTTLRLRAREEEQPRPLVSVYSENGALVYAGGDASMAQTLAELVALGLIQSPQVRLHRCPLRAWRFAQLRLTPLHLMEGADA